MDVLLQKVTQQAMNYAIRSGVMITSSYAINQCSRLVKNIKSEDRDELSRLQHRLDAKIRIIAPAIDMIELIAARGNTSLESAVTLTKSIRWDIQALGIRLSKAAADEEAAKRGSSKAKASEQLARELKLIVKDIRQLLERIEDAVPLINLAITTSGVSLSTNLPPTVSPSRLLQASTFLNAGDSQYTVQANVPTQIGPRFTTSVYMLFLGHAHSALNEEGLEKVVWKEVVHKAQMKLVRVPINKLNRFPFSTVSGGQNAQNQPNGEQTPSETPGAEFAYQLTMIEDLDDGRVHTFEDGETEPGPVDDVANAGIKTYIPIHEVAKIFYADTGKILNLGSGDTNNPVLLLRRDSQAPAPRRMMGQTPASPASAHDDANGPAHFTSSLPPGLDPEWIALEVFNEGFDSDEESDADSGDEPTTSSRPTSSAVQQRGSSLASAFSSLRLGSAPQQKCETDETTNNTSRNNSMAESRGHQPLFGITAPIATSLSLLEMLIRLTSLQQFQQSSHLAITDELLNFFLSEGSTTGAASGDAEARKRIRMEARQHVGFDPYDESPIKRRGEQYQYHVDDNEPSAYSPSVGNSAPQSPLAYESREPYSPIPSKLGRSSPFRHSSSTRATPPLPGLKPGTEPPIPMTPPGTSSSREGFLRNELGRNGSHMARSSPLRPSSPPGEDDPGAGQ